MGGGGGGQEQQRNSMPVHGDFGLFTLNIPLNQCDEEYQGGGTWFQALHKLESEEQEGGGSPGGGALLRPPRGHMVLHA